MRDGADRMLTSFLLVVVWVGIATCGDIWLKQTRGFGTWCFAGGVVSYSLCAVMAVVTFRRAPWGWVLLAWNCLSLAIGLWMSVALFHERFTIKRGIAAVLLAAAICISE
jgi:hypothetical protein